MKGKINEHKVTHDSKKIHRRHEINLEISLPPETKDLDTILMSLLEIKLKLSVFGEKRSMNKILKSVDFSAFLSEVGRNINNELRK